MKLPWKADNLLYEIQEHTETHEKNMDTFDAISKRRSIRKFKQDPVSPALITRCIEAARLAPSGTNCQPWKFLVVRSIEKRQQIMDAAYGQPMFGQAPVTMILLGDTMAYRKRFRTGQELMLVGAIDREDAEKALAAYRERKQAEDDAGAILMNCVIAGQNLILEATNEGLGSCWVMLFQKEQIAKIFNLPKTLFPVALIPLGYPDQDPPPRPRYPLEEIALDESPDRPWKR
jgi:nitroreductase